MRGSEAAPGSKDGLGLSVCSWAPGLEMSDSDCDTPEGPPGHKWVPWVLPPLLATALGLLALTTPRKYPQN